MLTPMKKVAVTGAAGHIGANLVRELLARAYRVAALVRKSSRALEGLDVERHDGNVQDIESLCRAFRGADTVFHLAAHVTINDGEWDTLQAVNVEGTRKVLQACCEERVSMLVHFSSIHALDMHPLDRPVTEENRLLDGSEGSEYERSKAQADRLVRDNDCASLSTRIIYPTAVIGPNDFSGSLTGQAIGKMASGRLPVLVTGGFDWVDVRDVAAGAVDAAEKGADGDRYILSGHYRGVTEMAHLISSLSGVAAPRLTVPRWLAAMGVPLAGAWARVRNETPLYTRDSLAALAANQNISHTLATQKLGYRPRPFETSIEDTLVASSQMDGLKS